MTKAVWAYSENQGVSEEVASAAVEVAKGFSGQPVVVEIGGARDGVRSPGPKLVLRGLPAGEPSPEAAAEAIARAAKAVQPAAILVGATRNGREVAARVAVKLTFGCLSEVSRLSSEGKALTGERYAFAGKVVARVTCPLPAVATVKIGFYPRAESASGATSESDIGKITPLVKVVRREKKAAGAVDLKSAKVIVSAGRGVKKKEDLPMLEELAKDMHGALGCSRPLSSDLGWLPEEQHIGLTGVSVKPDLYVAVGISGQLQHTAGMKDSKIVAAINTDKDAPIFQASDYGIVGDLYQVVPAIKKALASRR
jgi:electron transfer flavoprotein alpha subunit